MVPGAEVLALVGGPACVGVGVVRQTTLRRLRERRRAWQRFNEIPRPDREHRTWLVDLVARGRAPEEELDEVPARFLVTLLAVSRDQQSEFRFELASVGWLAVGLAAFFGGGLEGTWAAAGVVGFSILPGLVGRFREARRVTRRIPILERRLRCLEGTRSAREL